jgi:RluA family pseudouridine synthase
MVNPAILHEDEVLLAVDKPAGLPVVADPQNPAAGSLMDQVRARFGSGVANVHRLDAEATGVLLCAKSKAALDFLSGQFQAKTAAKSYQALVDGAPAGAAFDVDLALREDERQPGRMRVVKKGGRPASTRVEVLERFRGFAWVACRAVTGRPHQVRVHLAETGYPVLNDDLYGRGTRLLLSGLKRGYKGLGDERPLISRLALHANELTVRHPLTREPITLRAPLPKDLEVALKYLRRFARG